MPPITYPNQRMVKVHRESVKTDFLGIKNQNWKAASRNLRPPAFLLYLYLASNADNYTLALSPAAVRQEIGMARSTYHDQFHILVDKGYLVPAHGNTYDFYETPQPRPENQVGSHLSEDGYDFENSTSPDNAVVRNTHHVEQEDIQINNINNFTDSAGINNNVPQIDNIEQYIPKVKEVVISRPVSEGKDRPKPKEQKSNAAFEF